MPRRDAATYAPLISAHCRLGAPLDALRAFLDMLAWGCSDEEGAGDVVRPNEFTAAAVVQAYGLARDERLARMVHSYLVAGGFCGDPFVLSSLVNMYAKVGDVASARRLVLGLPCRDVVSWTTIISGCVLNAMLEEALGVFLMMLEDGVLPNNVTISACSHSGLISEGHKCFESMGRDHDIEPSMDHYACVVDLLGRSRRFAEAEQFIRDMPVRPEIMLCA